MDIEQDISEALAGRAQQRDFVDGLAADWRQLISCFSDLTGQAFEVVRGASRAQASDTSPGAAFGGPVRYLAPDATWQRKAEAVAARQAAAVDGVDTLHRRVHRQTVNIGVIGITGAGKSTLLRRISGLGEEHIPSNEYSSTTASPCRIFHDPGSGEGYARLDLHTWETFRDSVLAPLHEQAAIDPPPQALAGWRSFGYPPEASGVPEGQAGTERYRKRLRLAQASLPSYEHLLAGGMKEITLDRLRPYVAYPAEGDPRPLDRPYHAVRSVEVFCGFHNLGAVRLGLVDLPGAGEAGLDVHGRFLQDMRNDVDLLFIVKRPEKASTQVMDSDWDVVQLADDAAGGVRRDDFVHYIINRDATIPAAYLDRAVAAVQDEGQRLGFDVRECDIKNSPDVTAEVLQPVLAHLAKRLADMDRDAVQHVLAELREIAAQTLALADELAQQARSWLAALPDETERLRKNALEMRYQVGSNLMLVLKKYDGQAKARVPIAELEEEIEAAVTTMHDWVRGGLGEGSADEWLENFEDAVAGRETGRQLDRQYSTARRQVSEVFGRIDDSLARSVQALWGEIAAAMREKLTSRIIADSADPREVLSGFAAAAADRRLRTLAGATERLLDLQTDYGNIFLRVGRPIIREIAWYDPQSGGSGMGAAVAGGVVGGLVGHGVAAAAGPIAGAVAGTAASAAVKEGIKTGTVPSPGQWWVTHVSPGPSAPAAPGPAPQRGSRQQGPSAEVRAKYPAAAPEYTKLVSIIEKVTAELDREFRIEAQRAMRILAAATDLFIFSATGTPGVELEFEKLCQPFQRELWKKDFGAAPAALAAALAVLQDRTQQARITATRVITKAGQPSLL